MNRKNSQMSTWTKKQTIKKKGKVTAVDRGGKMRRIKRKEKSAKQWEKPATPEGLLPLDIRWAPRGKTGHLWRGKERGEKGKKSP